MKDFLFPIGSEGYNFWMSKFDKETGASQSLAKSRKTLDMVKWPKHHERVFGLKGGRPSEQDLKDMTHTWHKDCKAMFFSKPSREQEIVFYRKSSDVQTMDTSQRIDRTPMQQTATTPSLCTNSSIFVYKVVDQKSNQCAVNRWMFAEELLAIKGINTKRFPNLRQFPASFLSTLSGNAFSGPCFQSIFLSGMSVFPFKPVNHLD